MSVLRQSLCVVSDLHFMAWKVTELPVEWVPSLKRSLSDIAALGPDLLVVNGDLTNGKDRDYRLAMRILKETCAFPVCFTMGNHEYYDFYEDPHFTLAGARERFLAYTGMDSIYYEKRLDGCTLLFLSTEAYAPDTNDAGWLSSEQLAWLEARLRLAPEGPVFAFFHQPVNDTVAESTNTCVQSERLRDILGTRPGVFWITGHTHCRMDREDQLALQDGVVYVGGGCLCGDFPQSRWIELYDDKIVMRLRDHRNETWVDDFEFAYSL